MAISSEFKRAMKFRTRRSRRLSVVVFVGFVAAGFWSATLPLEFWPSWSLYPVVWLCKGSYASWDRRRRVIPVSTLDDRAMLEHGMKFDDLGKREQGEILNAYSGGTLLLNYLPDEREHELQASAHVRAYSLIRFLLPALLLISWMEWRWVARTNLLVLLFWVVLVVLALPQVILMWTEPEDVREMQLAKPVVGAEREA